MIQHSLDGYTGYQIAAMLIITASTVYRRLDDYKKTANTRSYTEKTLS
jgi:transposase